MNEKIICPFEKYLLELQSEEIIFIKGKAFIIKPATLDEIKCIHNDDQ
jgi:hypothetical protein